MGGRTWLSLCFALLAIITLAGCSGSSSANLSSTGPVPVSMTIRDTPPSGVSVLSFEIHVTGASLQPQSSGASPVALISQPEEFELEHLQTSAALVGNDNVAAGTYDSLTVTFANPQMTILNNSGSTLTVGGTSCASGQVCEVQPTLNQAAVTLTSSPFPLTLSASSPVSLALDFNLDSSVLNDLSVTPVVTVTSVSTSSTSSDSGQENDMEFFGLVTGVDGASQSFTLQDGLNGQTDTILTDSNTEFDFENENCQAANFSCIAKGDIVKVEAQMNGGTLTATEVDGVGLPQTQAVTGTVVSINPSLNQFQIVLQEIEDSQDGQTLTLGLPVTVSVQTGATFDVNAGGLSLAGVPSFGGFSNLVAGQELSVAVSGVQTSGSAVTVDTDHVTLEMSEISGTADSGSIDTGQGTFTLSGLSGLFTSTGVSQILVQTSGSTEFENTTGLASLTGNPAVSVSGLLLPNPNNTSEPELVASVVRVRQN